MKWRLHSCHAVSLGRASWNMFREKNKYGDVNRWIAALYFCTVEVILMACWLTWRDSNITLHYLRFGAGIAVQRRVGAGESSRGRRVWTAPGEGLQHLPELHQETEADHPSNGHRHGMFTGRRPWYTLSTVSTISTTSITVYPVYHFYISLTCRLLSTMSITSTMSTIVYYAFIKSTMSIIVYHV